MTILEDAIISSRKLSERSKAIYLEGVQRFIAFGGPYPSQWTPAAIETWQRMLAEGQLTNTRVSPQSINTYTKGVRYASRRWAERERNPALDFARVVEPMRVGPPVRPIRVLDLAQARRLRKACDGSQPSDLNDAALITCGLRLGLRRESLRLATIEATDLRTRTMIVPIKGGRILTVPLDDECVNAIQRWLTWLRRHDAASGSLFRSFYQPGLTEQRHRVGGIMSRSGIARTVAKRAELAGLGKLNPHALRHTYVTLARQAGVSDDEIAKRTGHRPSGGGIRYPMLNTYTAEPTRALELPSMEG
mgnify:CR=1 FL=1